MKPERIGAKSEKRVGTDFTQGAIMPMLISFAIPFLLGNLLTALYNTVDSIIVGHLIGSAGFVAVTVGGKTLNLFTHISVSFATGGQVYIGQLEGAKQRDRLNRAIGTLFTEILIVSVAIGALSFIFAGNIVSLLDTPEEAVADSILYLKITAAGLPFVFGYNAVSAILRGMGDSRRPLIFVAIAAVFNVFGDLLFVMVLHMGVAGTAVATIMAQFISLAFSIVVLYRERDRFGFDFRLSSFIPKGDVFKALVKVSVPLALRDFMVFGSQLILVGWANGFGVVEAAAFAVGDRIFHIAVIITISFRQSSAAMMAQNVGAGLHDRVTGIMKACYKICGIIVAAMCIVSLLIPTQIFGIFSEDPAVLAFAKSYMLVCCLTYILSNIGGPLEGMVVATGRSRLNMFTGVLDSLVFRLLLGWLCAYPAGLRGVGLFMGDSLARLAPIIVYSIFYFSGSWKKSRRVID